MCRPITIVLLFSVMVNLLFQRISQEVVTCGRQPSESASLLRILSSLQSPLTLVDGLMKTAVPHLQRKGADPEPDTALAVPNAGPGTSLRTLVRVNIVQAVPLGLDAAHRSCDSSPPPWQRVFVILFILFYCVILSKSNLPRTVFSCAGRVLFPTGTIRLGFFFSRGEVS